MDKQSAAGSEVSAGGGVAGRERLWLWDTRREEVRKMSLAEVGSQFEPRRFMAFSLDPFSARVGLKDVLACREYDGQAELVGIGPAGGSTIALAKSHRVLTIGDGGHITCHPPSEIKRGLMLRHLEIRPGVPTPAAMLAEIMDESGINPETDTDYEWLRQLTIETWGWDRLEEHHRVRPEMLDRLRFDVARRANKIRIERLKKMDCRDCLVKIAGHLARGTNLMDTLDRLERVWPVVLSVEAMPSEGPLFTLEIEGHGNFLTAKGLFLNDGSVSA